MNDEKQTPESLIRSGNFYASTTSGISMYPLLRDRKDMIVVSPVKGRLKKYDVALFRRENGQLVLHRVIKVLPDGYIIRGDNCVENEKVDESRIVGVLTGFRRGKNDNTHTVNGALYKIYSRVAVYGYPFRAIYKRTKSFIKKVRS